MNFTKERDCWSRIPPWVAAELEQVFFFLGGGGIQVEAVLLLRKCEMYFGVFNYDIYIYTCIIILIDWL